MNMQTGYVVGNAAAINVELGWIPDMVIVTNLTGADKITIGHLGKYTIPFSGGGTTEIVAGNTIIGATSGARAVVDEVLLYSGTWAGGDAAGFFTARDVTGTFGTENVFVGTGTDDATVTVQTTINLSIDTEVAAETSTNMITRYYGVAGSNARGFTIGAGVAVEAEALHWLALAGN